MSNRRLSPKEIKHDIREDELSTSVTSFVDWLAAHRRGVVIGLVAVVALAIVGAIGAAVLEDRRDDAAAELGEVIEIYQAPLADEPTPVTETAAGKQTRYASEEERRAAAREKAESIGGPGAGAAGEIAELYLADIAVREGDTARAREIWESYLADNQGSVLAASVKLNLLRLDRQEGKGEAVVAELRRSLEDPTGPLPEDTVLFELGTTLDEMGQEDEAREIFQRLVDEHPQSPFTARAQQRTAEAA